MVWVPKGGPQRKDDVQVLVARIAARMKEENIEAGKKSTSNIPSYCKKFRSSRHPHYSAMPF
jgi:hypothetical protein